LRVTGGQLTVNGDFAMNALVNLSAIGPGVKFAANGPTSIDVLYLEAAAGGNILLPTLTDYAFSTSRTDYFWIATGASSTLNLSELSSITASGRFHTIRASDGGRIDLRNLTRVNNPSNQSISVVAQGTGSVVDISSLAGLGRNGVNSISATGTSTVLWSRPTALDGMALTLDGSATLPVSQLTEFVNSNFTGNGSTPNFSNVTNVTNSGFTANGGKIALPSINSYAFTGFPDWQASGTNSALDFSSLSTITANGGELDITASNGGLIDLRNLTQLNNPSNRPIRVNASGDGLIDISSLNAFGRNGVNSVSVSGTSSVLWGDPSELDTIDLRIFGSGKIATGQIIEFVNSNLVVSGATPDFSRTTNIDNSSFEVQSAGTVAIHRPTRYALNGFRRFSASNATLDLSGLSTIQSDGGQLDVVASGGGLIDLRGLHQITNRLRRPISVLADGANSIVDMSSLEHFEGGSIQTRNSGVVLLSDGTTSFTGTRLTTTRSGGPIRAGTLELGADSVLEGNGTISANVTNTSGTIAPLIGQERLTIEKNYLQGADGRILAAISSPSIAAAMAVNGAASLAGSLDIALTQGYTGPQLAGATDMMTLLTASNGVSGTFDRGTDNKGNGIVLDVTYNTNDVQFRLQRLSPGDANKDLRFDQGDIVRVLAGGKYVTGQRAAWGEGDWDARGDALFNQRDIVAALGSGTYLTGPYAATGDRAGGNNYSKPAVLYDARTGEVAITSPATELSSISLESSSGIFTAAAAQNLGGPFDLDTDHTVFKASFGSGFGSLSFGNVAQPGLSSEFLLQDVIAFGSIQDGGTLDSVDFVYIPVPEPAAFVLMVVGLFGLVLTYWERYRKCLAHSGPSAL
jgi:hypothetical protein